LLKLIGFFQRLNLGNARVFIVDIPIGNSLMARLLDHLLSATRNVQILRASLSRNDRRGQGITRAELLSEQIQILGVSANDVILYVDEWNTGANFKNICKILKRLVPEKSFLFPAATLSLGARDDSRFDSFCLRHDELLKPWGVNGSDFRAVLEPLKSPCQTEGYFFGRKRIEWQASGNFNCMVLYLVPSTMQSLYFIMTVRN
jgi:hypothetical protein